MRLELELMEGETRKRKITNVEYDVVQEEAEDDDDDVKMEKFFALIRSAKDIRDQLLDADVSQPRATTAGGAIDKKIEAVRSVATNKKAVDSVKAHRKDKGLADVLIAANQPPSAAVAGGGRSSRGATEEEKGKKTAEYSNNNNNKNSYQRDDRMVLDLNLSL